MKKCKGIICAVILCMLLPVSVYAHPGRTDSAGGHHDYKNQSGLGSYHYHHGMPAHLHPGGVCPYSGGTPSYTAPTPPKPSVTINNPPVQLNVGDSTGLDVTLANVSQNAFNVTSSNPHVVRVNADNTLTAVGEGDTTITVSASGAENKAFVVTVKTVPVESISIKSSNTKVQLDKTIKYEAEALPNNATDKTIMWKSDNKEIATVAEDGTVTGHKVGKTKIICQAINGVTSEVEVEVFEILPEKIEVDVNHIKLECTKLFNLNVTVLPEEANDKSYTLFSSDESVAKITNNKIEAISDGKTTIIIVLKNDVKYEIPIETFHVPTEDIKIDDSSMEYFLNLSSFKVIDKKTELQLDTVISPSDATFENAEWKSSNDKIVTFDDGEMFIVGTGKVVLTAEAHDGQTDSITIYVVSKVVIIMITGILVIIIITVLVKKNWNKILKLKEQYMVKKN